MIISRNIRLWRCMHIINFIHMECICDMYCYVYIEILVIAIISWNVYFGRILLLLFFFLVSKFLLSSKYCVWPWESSSAAAKSLQSCPTLCDPIDGSPPGSSIHGIFQAKVLEWGAIAFSRNQVQVRPNSWSQWS